MDGGDSNPLGFTYIDNYFDECLEFRTDLGLTTEQIDTILKDKDNQRAVT